MKIRTGFVSNSSSSSFLVPGDLSEHGIACFKLTEDQVKNIRERIEKSKHENFKREKLSFFDSHKDIWVTKFINDGTPDYGRLDELCENIEYFDGQLCEEPYDEDLFEILVDDGWDGVIWIYGEDSRPRGLVKKILRFFKGKMEHRREDLDEGGEG